MRAAAFLSIGLRLLGTHASIDVGRAGAAIDLLVARGAIALGVISSTIELVATGARVQDVMLVGKGVAEFTSESVRQKLFKNSKNFYIRAELIWKNVR